MSNEITITESAMKKVLSSDENLRLKVVVETLYEKVKELEEELDDIKTTGAEPILTEETAGGRPSS